MIFYGDCELFETTRERERVDEWKREKEKAKRRMRFAFLDKGTFDDDNTRRNRMNFSRELSRSLSDYLRKQQIPYVYYCNEFIIP